MPAPIETSTPTISFRGTPKRTTFGPIENFQARKLIPKSNAVVFNVPQIPRCNATVFNFDINKFNSLE